LGLESTQNFWVSITGVNVCVSGPGDFEAQEMACAPTARWNSAPAEVNLYAMTGCSAKEKTIKLRLS
jgi:hypothetical protein